MRRSEFVVPPRSRSLLQVQLLEDRAVPAVLTVDDDGGKGVFTTIQAAVDAANPGDTIKVRPGTYDEQVTISDDLDGLTLRGQNSKQVHIVPPEGDLASPFALVHVNGATGVTIERFTIGGPADQLAAGIIIDHGGSASVLKNDIVDIRTATPELFGLQTGFAVQVGGDLPDGEITTGTALIDGNTIRDFQKDGILVFAEGSFASISRNEVTGVGPNDVIAQNAIEIVAGGSATITDNTISDVFYTPEGTEGSGIGIFDAKVVVAIANKISNTEVGILVESQTFPLIISANKITDSELDGISLTGATGPSIISSNRVSGSGRDGIRLVDTTDTLVVFNRSTNNDGNGITVTGASEDNTIIMNVFVGNGGLDAFDDTNPGDNTWLFNEMVTRGGAALS